MGKGRQDSQLFSIKHIMKNKVGEMEHPKFYTMIYKALHDQTSNCNGKPSKSRGRLDLIYVLHNS